MRSPPSLRFIVGTLATVFLFAACTDDPTQPERPDLQLPQLSEVAAEGDHMVVLPEGQTPSDELLAEIEAAGGAVLHRHDEIGVFMVGGLSDDDAVALEGREDVRSIQRDMEIQWIPPMDDSEFEAQGIPEDFEADATNQSGAFFFALQYYLPRVSAPAAWAHTRGGLGTQVCILDTGIDPIHVDLIGKIDLARSASFVPSEPHILDLNFHGSFVASLVSTNGVGMASIAPDARLIAVKVLNRFGFGSFDSVIDGIFHCAAVGGEVANMSLSGVVLRSAARDLILALRRAVAFGGSRGMLSVAAAGNSGVNWDDPAILGLARLPAQIPGVTSVGATDQNDNKAGFSDFGFRGVRVTAPGVDMLGVCSHFSTIFTICGTGTFWLIGPDGTSFSSPLTSGLAANVKSDVPSAGPVRLKNCIRAGADDLGAPGLDPVYGYGRINALRTVLLPGC